MNFIFILIFIIIICYQSPFIYSQYDYYSNYWHGYGWYRRQVQNNARTSQSINNCIGMALTEKVAENMKEKYREMDYKSTRISVMAYFEDCEISYLTNTARVSESSTHYVISMRNMLNCNGKSKLKIANNSEPIINHVEVKSPVDYTTLVAKKKSCRDLQVKNVNILSRSENTIHFMTSYLSLMRNGIMEGTMSKKDPISAINDEETYVNDEIYVLLESAVKRRNEQIDERYCASFTQPDGDPLVYEITQKYTEDTNIPSIIKRNTYPYPPLLIGVSKGDQMNIFRRGMFSNEYPNIANFDAVACACAEIGMIIVNEVNEIGKNVNLKQHNINVMGNFRMENTKITPDYVIYKFGESYHAEFRMLTRWNQHLKCNNVTCCSKRINAMLGVKVKINPMCNTLTLENIHMDSPPSMGTNPKAPMVIQDMDRFCSHIDAYDLRSSLTFNQINSKRMEIPKSLMRTIVAAETKDEFYTLYQKQHCEKAMKSAGMLDKVNL